MAINPSVRQNLDGSFSAQGSYVCGGEVEDSRTENIRTIEEAETVARDMNRKKYAGTIWARDYDE